MVDKFRSRPTTTAVGATGAVATIFFYVGSLLGWNPPPEVAAAITTLLAAAGVEVRYWLTRMKGEESAEDSRTAEGPSTSRVKHKAPAKGSR